MELIAVYSWHRKLRSIKYFLKMPNRVERIMLQDYKAKEIIKVFDLTKTIIFNTPEKIIYLYQKIS